MSYHEKSGTELLAPLNVDPDRPSRVDIAAAMTTGRRKRRLGLAAAGAAVVALAGGTAVGGTLAFDGPGPDPAPERLPACVATPCPWVATRRSRSPGPTPPAATSPAGPTRSPT
nr:hypothetical protein GCM10020092_049340 [Actinoplanes digitatis]